MDPPRIAVPLRTGIAMHVDPSAPITAGLVRQMAPPADVVAQVVFAFACMHTDGTPRRAPVRRLLRLLVGAGRRFIGPGAVRPGEALASVLEFARVGALGLDLVGGAAWRKEGGPSGFWVDLWAYALAWPVSSEAARRAATPSFPACDVVASIFIARVLLGRLGRARGPPRLVRTPRGLSVRRGAAPRRRRGAGTRRSPRP